MSAACAPKTSNTKAIPALSAFIALPTRAQRRCLERENRAIGRRPRADVRRWPARAVVVEELAEIGHQRRWSDDAAQAPPGHQPRFGKTVGAYDAVRGIGKIEEGRGAVVTAVVKPLVDIVGDDPDAVLAAMRENRLLRLALECPAGRVVRRIDHYRACSR